MAEQALSHRFKELCNDLNLDKSTTDDAWKSFQKIRLEYILEGDKIHWLACAIYVACRKSLPAVGTKGHSIEGNCVSLTRLLRSCKLSLVEFFSKMKKWLDMANQSHDIRSKVEHLERNFNVSAVIFKKYRPIMMDMLHPSLATSEATQAASSESASESESKSNETQTSSNETQTAPPTPVKGRGKSSSMATGASKKPVQVKPSDVFDFCWTLYVNVKSMHSSISDDLVNSYHLLLACIDLCYANALQCDNATELLNSAFSELPKNFGTDEFKLQSAPSQPPCILQALCNKWDGIVVEAKGIREHWWKPYLKKLLERKVLKCNDVATFTGLFEASNFEHNIRQLTREYDHCVLNIGDFDERVFLSSNAHEELGTPAYDVNDLNKQMVQRMGGENAGAPKPQQQSQHQQRKGKFVPQTPLSNRQYLDNREIGSMTPVSNATQSVSRLHSMLVNRKDSPSQTLDNIFKLCPENPSDEIVKRLNEMCDKFAEAHNSGEITKRRVDLGRRLYFKVLENIMLREQKKLPTNKIGESLGILLAHETFHVSLFACCMEIVMASYNSRTFPWILEVFNDFRGSRLHPFQFYKVIEPLIRDEEGLSRDIVKHLNSIEERILEKLAWESDSPLWPAIEANACVPRSEEVPLPKSSTDHTPPGMSPLTYLKRREGFQSPISTSERYSSALESGARRRLFAQSDSSGAGSSQAASAANQVTVSASGATVVSGSPQGQIVHIAVPTQTPSGIKYVQLQAIAMPVSQANSHTLEGLTTVVSASDLAAVTAAVKVDDSESMPVRPVAKSNPVNLFFRKVYNLAHLRLRDFWSRLQIENQDLRRKIWTLFENQLRTHTDLMRDRHLDQMLMCAIYAVFKVCRLDRTANFFQEILRAYRLQPQHCSAVYRSVLLQSVAKSSSDTASESATVVVAASSSPGRPGAVTRSPSKRHAVSANNSPARPVNGFQKPTSGGSDSLGGGSLVNDGTHRGDLIQFYNNCYVPQVERLVRRLRPDIPETSLMLSPLPQLPTCSASPWRRVSQQHSVYVSPLRNASSISLSPGRPLSYSFQRSPAKDLRTINDMINRDRRVVSKRILQDTDGENASSAKRLCAFIT